MDRRLDQRISDSSSISNNNHGVDFLGQVEQTVETVLLKYYGSRTIPTTKSERDAVLHRLPRSERETAGVVHHLHARLTALVGRKNHQNCRRCWMNLDNCICAQIESLEDSKPACIDRIFVLCHHKEVGMLVDTAKLILNAFPQSSRLVVAGLSADVQPAMNEFQEALRNNNHTLVLFPDQERSKTFAEWYAQDQRQQRQLEQQHSQQQQPAVSSFFDVVVLDGTWNQARRMYQRYISNDINNNNNTNNTRCVHLSDQSLSTLTHSDSVGQQLRHHPQVTRQIATAHALQLLLQDVISATAETNDNQQQQQQQLQQLQRLDEYQEISNAAVRRQLPPVRYRTGHQQYL